MTVTALVLAAGQGLRLRQGVPKAFVCLRGKALLQRSLEAMAAVSAVSRVVPVVAGADLERYATLELSGIVGLASPVPGGAARQDSLSAGLAALPRDTEWVAVHDAARCLVTVAEVDAVLAAARQTGGAILARPCADTLKRVDGDRIVETPDRWHYWAAQTPQVFRADVLREALEKARAEGFVGTDDAQLVERLGVAVQVVEGRASNLKITHPEDLALAEVLLDGLLGSGAAEAGAGAG